MKSTKRYFSAMLVISMLLTSVGVYAEVDTQTKSEVVSINSAVDEAGIVLDFENIAEEGDTLGFTAINTGTVVKNETGSGLKIDLGKCLKNIEPVSEGRYLLSFEINSAMTDGAKLLLRLLGYDHGNKLTDFVDADTFEVSNITNKKYRYYEYLNGIRESNYKRWALVEDGDIDPDATNRIDIYLDMTERRAYQYLNNEFICEEIIPPQLKTIYGFYLSGEGGSFVLDNVIFSGITGQIKQKLDALGVEYPEVWRGDLNIRLNETEFGNNYFSGSPELEFTMVNESDSFAEYDVSYVLKNEFGQTVYTKVETLSFEENESKIHKSKLSANYYGVMTMTVTATKKEMENTSTYTKHIALINAPDGGKRNPVLGFTLQNRATHLDYYDEIVDLFAEGGFSNLRFGITNGYRVYDDGKIVYKDYEKTIIDAIKRNKLDWNCVLSDGNKQWDDMPRDASTLAQWSDYCYQVALDTNDNYGGEVSYEIWNEPNAKSFNPYGTPEDYVELARVSREALRKVNPNAEILVGSLSGISTTYMNYIIDVGKNDVIDAVSVHPYMWMQGPESGNMFPSMLKFQDVLEKGGLGDRPVWWTEIGWYTHVGIPNQAIYTAQMFILNEVNGRLAEKIQIFDATDDDRLPRETFGLINSSIDYDPFLARPSFLAMSNYTELMTDAKFVETISYDATQNLYRFKLANGKDMLVFWTLDGNNQIAMDLGTDTVEVCDLYGNVTKQSGIKGQFQFDANIYPQYVIGNFAKSEKCEELFDVSKDSFDVVNGDKVAFQLSNKTNEAVNVSFSVTENIKPVDAFKMQKGKKTVVIEAKDISSAGERTATEGSGIIRAARVKKLVDDDLEGVVLKLTDGNKVYYQKRMEVTCVPEVSVEHYVAHDSGDRWLYIVEAVNNKYSDEISGTVKIEEPSDFKWLVPTWSIGKIGAGQKKKIKIPIPDLVDRNDTSFVGSLVLADGFSVDISQELSYRGLPKTRIAPKIDGVIEDGEWPSAYMIQMNKNSGTVIPLEGPYNGDDDISADIYMCFDDTKIYFAAKVRDDVQVEDTQKRLWSSDGFQFNVAMERSAAAPYTELGLALIDGIPSITRDSGLIAMGIGVDFPKELQIVRNEEKKETIYEFSVPFTEIYPPDFNVREHSSLNISILLNDRDSKDTPDRDTMLEWGSGIGNSKDPSLYFNYSLIR